MRFCAGSARHHNGVGATLVVAHSAAHIAHLVSAWAAANRLVLGQVAVDDKSNEITAIPLLLDLLEVRGSTITIDAGAGGGVCAQQPRFDL